MSQHIFLTQILFTQQFFYPNFFKTNKYYLTQIFFTKILGPHFQRQNSLTTNNMGFDTIEINLVLV